MITKLRQVPNFCRPDSMYVCAAGNSVENQKRCRFYRKATRTVRCMHYRAHLEGHCDSIEAQQAADDSTMGNRRSAANDK